MIKIYKVKEGVTMDEFMQKGFDRIPNANNIIFKFCPQPLDGELCQGKLAGIYTNPKWIEKFYKPHKQHFIDYLGLRYHKDGTIKFTKKFEVVLASWRLQIDWIEDGWLGFTSLDENDQTIYYNKDAIDRIFKEEIEQIKDLLEVIEVEENN